VWWFAPEQQRWILQPLVDAGLAAEEISALLCRLAVDATVSDGLEHAVSDRPDIVRAAWTHTIDRLLSLPGPVAQPHIGPLPTPRSAS
jgi:hypothetical protein